MPQVQQQPEIVTLTQYEALPENRRVEVFDGVVYDMASPSQIHQMLSNYFEHNIVSVPYPFDSIIKVHIFDDLYISFSDIANLLDI